MRPPSRREAYRPSLHFDDVRLGAFDERNDLAVLLRRHLELIQRRVEVLHQRGPTLPVDLHAHMGEFHLAPAVIERPAGSRGRVINMRLIICIPCTLRLDLVVIY